MTPKKRASLSTKPNAYRMRKLRRQEDGEDTEERLRKERETRALSRCRETAAETEKRLGYERETRASSRCRETAAEKQQRQQTDRETTALSRRRETAAKKQQRQASDRARKEEQRHWTDKKNAAFSYDCTIDYESDKNISIGEMNTICTHCGASKWPKEAPGMCCSNGKVKLPALQSPPDPLNSLMAGNSTLANAFLRNIRQYNSCFQMTSFGATEVTNYAGFMPTFTVQGQVYHLHGSLLPETGEPPAFLQIYFMGDEDAQAQQRCEAFPNVDKTIVAQLQKFLHENNNYVKSFKTAIERMPDDNFKAVIRADKKPPGGHERQYNAPTVNEVGIVIVGQQFEKRDIVIQKRGQALTRVLETHRSYDALQYPLIFWQGEDGYSIDIYQVQPRTGVASTKKVSAMQFYSYRLMLRENQSNHIFKSRNLLSQFLTDMYAKIETERLLYIRLNQTKLRAEQYIHLKDAVANESNPSNIGQMVILPATFTGSPRYMHEYTQDAMTYVRNYGRPDLFITFTCNPNWPEITQNLIDGQPSYVRHDIVARVFNQKVKLLRNLLTNDEIFGATRCYMYSIEWQKRGLPHVHLLLWLVEKVQPSQIDSLISVEIPNEETDPILFNIVKKNMIHGPCGYLNPKSPCMKDGRCTKGYPKNFIAETQCDRDGYPLYRRRKLGEGGFSFTLKLRGQEVVIGNSWVVPHCPLLSRLLNAHINVEYCHSVKSIKYICKYINKGSDQAVFGLQKNAEDEIYNFQMGRYISTNEAVWRILNFLIHQRYPTVIHLSVHLENGQRVYFTERNIHQRAAEPPKTTLTEFFHLCTNDPFARTILYHQVPRYYTWQPNKSWKRRLIGSDVDGHPGMKSSDALGRVYTVHPNNYECFYLRLLLHVVNGPSSFEDLRTVDGQVCATYQEACLKRGLLEDDKQWDHTMEEAAVSRSPAMLRSLFAIIISCCHPSDPKQLWENHKMSLSEDILHKARLLHETELDYSTEIFNEALVMIEDKTIMMASKTLQDLGLPSPDRTLQTVSREIRQETSYDTEKLLTFVAEVEPKLTTDQQLAFQAVVENVRNNNGGLYFLSAPGGTGKTFIINLLLAKIRSSKGIALAVPSSGIAATLLDGGRTAHSTFKLPLDLTRSDTPVCNIKKATGLATLLAKCQLIIWDECTMSHKGAFEALDRSLRDIRECNKVMGGLTMLLSGDFRQTLPIVPRGTAADEIKACLKSSYLWRYVHTLSLSTNMRVHILGDIEAGTFATKVLEVGDGKIPSDNAGYIEIESQLGNIVASVEELMSAVYPNLQNNFTNFQWLRERAIMAPRNDTVNVINFNLLQIIPGEQKSFQSIDTVMDLDQVVNYPVEFLNSLDPPGLPSHNLVLKIGAPVMLLRNLDAPKLCNGTRLIVKAMMDNVIEATILTGCAAGQDVFIPRIPLIPSDMPFEFKRLQFPLRLSFAMSINKSQGQSLKVAGIHLMTPCFSHGQLYVAMSRVGSSKHLFILTPSGKTVNVVYPAAL